MFLKIDLLKNFIKFTEKHLFWSLLQVYSSTTLLKRYFLTPTQVFSCEICEIFKNLFFFLTEHLEKVFDFILKL